MKPAADRAVRSGGAERRRRLPAKKMRRVDLDRVCYETESRKSRKMRTDRQISYHCNDR